MNTKKRIIVTFIIAAALIFTLTQVFTFLKYSLDIYSPYIVDLPDDNYPFVRGDGWTRLSKDTYITNFYDKETGVEYILIIRGRDTVFVQPRSSSTGGIVLHNNE
jgi:hypothetical protein